MTDSIATNEQHAADFVRSYLEKAGLCATLATFRKETQRSVPSLPLPTSSNTTVGSQPHFSCTLSKPFNSDTSAPDTSPKSADTMDELSARHHGFSRSSYSSPTNDETSAEERHDAKTADTNGTHGMEVALSAQRPAKLARRSSTDDISVAAERNGSQWGGVPADSREMLQQCAVPMHYDYMMQSGAGLRPPGAFPLPNPSAQPSYARMPAYPSPYSQDAHVSGPMMYQYAMGAPWFAGYQTMMPPMGAGMHPPGSPPPVMPRGHMPPPQQQMPTISGTKRKIDGPTYSIAPEVPASRRVRMSTTHVVADAEGKFHCPVEGCGKVFTQRTNLRRHMVAHTGQKPFACDVCGRAFTRSDDLGIHLRTHTGDRPYKCTLCTKKFTRASDLNAHVKTHDAAQTAEALMGAAAYSLHGSNRKSASETASSDEAAGTHQHGMDCGHKPVFFEGQIAFLLEDGFLATESGCVPFSTGAAVTAEEPHTHSDDSHHHHAATCGHPIVRHDDHFDFLVNGALHHVDEHGCVVHGQLDEIDQDTLGLLTGLDELKASAAAT